MVLLLWFVVFWKVALVSTLLSILLELVSTLRKASRDHREYEEEMADYKSINEFTGRNSLPTIEYIEVIDKEEKDVS